LLHAHECENILDEDHCDDAYNADEWTTSNKDSPDPGFMHDEEEIKKLKEKIERFKAKIKNSNSLQDAVKKCNEKYKSQLEELKTKFINELKQREALNKNNIEEITKNLTEYAQNAIKSKVEGYNNNIQNVLNTKIEASKTKLTQDNQDINNILKDINNNKDDIKKQIGESNTNFSKIIEISQINVNDNK
jgi:DNA repair exonuclease SbcCD ATPase subunit